MKGFTKTRYANLRRNNVSGIYYAFARVGNGREIAKSLKTKTETVAKTRLSTTLAKIRGRAGKLTGPNLTLGECAELYLESKRTDKNLKPKAIKYREQTVDSIVNGRLMNKDLRSTGPLYEPSTWPNFRATMAAEVTVADCERWAKKTKPKYSSSYFNGMLQSLRGIFEEAISAGCCDKNPAKPILTHKGTAPLRPAKVFAKRKAVYSFDEMDLLWAALKAKRGHGYLFCRFLYLFTLRVETVRHLTLAMADRDAAQFKIPGEYVKGERAGTVIHAPIFPEMFLLLDELDKELGKEREKLLPIDGCLDLLRKVCKEIGLPYMNHHAFRHTFTTHALLKGKPVDVVAKWLNHKDGGALLLKRYNHVLNTASRDHAATLNFRNSPEEKIHVLKAS